MIYLQWFLIGSIILIGIVGGCYQLMLFACLKKQSASTLFFGEWVFNPDVLNDKGKYYRKVILACWLLGIAILIVIRKIS